MNHKVQTKKFTLGPQLRRLIIDEIELLSMESPTDEESERRIKLAGKLHDMLCDAKSITLVY